MISKSKRLFYALSAVLLLSGAFTFFAIPAVDVEAAWCVERGDPTSEPFWVDECTPAGILQAAGETTRWRTQCTDTEGGIVAGTRTSKAQGDRVVVSWCPSDTVAGSIRNVNSSSEVGYYFTVVCSDGESAYASPDPSAPVTNWIVCRNGERAEVRSESVVNPAPVGDGDPEPDPGSSGPCDGGNTESFEVCEPGTIPNTTPVVIGCASAGAPGTLESPILCEFIRIVRFLTIGVSVVAAITVAVTGLQYTMSRGDPSKTSQAVQRLAKVGAGIVLYLFGWALLEFLIPGGPV